jgi:NAD(P)H dehydrogenase (quinone)
VKVLIVVAHPMSESFTLARVRRFADGVAAAGHEAEVANLYEEGFDPVVSVQEMALWRQGEVPPEVRAYQERLRQSDALVLAYPVWWNMPPAILAGWLQRVLTTGFAFRHEGGRTEGLLRMRAQLLVSVGTQGRDDVDLQTLYFEPLHGVLRYSGMDVLPPDICWGVHPKSDAALLQRYLEATYHHGCNFLLERARENMV